MGLAGGNSRGMGFREGDVEMNATGTELQKFVRQVRTLSTQLASVLVSADELMGERKWDMSMAQNIAFASMSTSLKWPRYWYPNEVFRFYQCADRADRLAFVSILLDDDRDEDYVLQQPLLTAGWFDFPEGVQPAPVTSATYWWARFHGYVPDRRDDGQVVTTDVSNWKDVSYPFTHAHTLGVPLAELTGAGDIKTRIIGPLLDAMHPAEAPVSR